MPAVRACGSGSKLVHVGPECVCVHHTVGTVGETHYPMARVPSAPAIKFKGSGFYVNDYKDK
jgi:predicted nucleic acid-binding Zn ribbon protein